jgi:hypothetical protein
MRIAIATNDFTAVSGHAGQARQWLVYDRSQHHASQLVPDQRFDITTILCKIRDLFSRH